MKERERERARALALLGRGETETGDEIEGRTRRSFEDENGAARLVDLNQSQRVHIRTEDGGERENERRLPRIVQVPHIATLQRREREGGKRQKGSGCIDHRQEREWLIRVKIRA